MRMSFLGRTDFLLKKQRKSEDRFYLDLLEHLLRIKGFRVERKRNRVSVFYYREVEWDEDEFPFYLMNEMIYDEYSRFINDTVKLVNQIEKKFEQIVREIGEEVDDKVFESLTNVKVWFEDYSNLDEEIKDELVFIENDLNNVEVFV